MAAPAAAQTLRTGVLGGYRRLLRLRKHVSARRETGSPERVGVRDLQRGFVVVPEIVSGASLCGTLRSCLRMLFESFQRNDD